MKLMTLSVFAGIALSVAAACSMIKKDGGSPATTGGGGGGAPLGDTMADAVVYSRGATISTPAACHTSGYAKLDVAAGEALQLEVAVTSPGEEACVSFWVLNSNGGAAGVTDELCSTKSPKTYEVTVPDGGALLQISEGGKCQGATVAVAIK